ncbi:hypothetical protein LLO_0591 [Legionella longbeachae NSW150]|uniref:Uncharacterized protein n=1 Tax=Legionella longbeachae serogroup 1 (strain NSW150) TaxID=661367 RepID=D3HPW2_LEGLN|nr:hypothetical protein LLO_0591 [Legionella longbeachae NSW150]
MVLPPRDFKSLASTCFATWAIILWRLRPESNRRTRLCRPLHDHSATQPHFDTSKSTRSKKKATWSSLNLERETRLELATPTLARLCSTN